MSAFQLRGIKAHTHKRYCHSAKSLINLSPCLWPVLIYFFQRNSIPKLIYIYFWWYKSVLAIYQYPIHLGVHVFHALATALPNKKADTDWLHYWGGKYSLTRKLSFYYNPVMKSWIFVKGPKKLQLWRYNFKEAGRNDLRRESWYGYMYDITKWIFTTTRIGSEMKTPV